MPVSNSDARKRIEESKRIMDTAILGGTDPIEAAAAMVDRMNAAVEMETTIIGLSGWAQSGKDSTATVFADVYGYEKLAFADKLRDLAYAVNPLIDIGELDEGIEFYAHAFRTFGYEAIKQQGGDGGARGLLQRLGNSVRDVLGDLTWVNACLDAVQPGGKYVVTDVRYQNEAQAIKDRGGQVWRITRGGHVAANDHISEHDLDDWKFDHYLSLPDFGDDLDALYPAIAQMVGIAFEGQRA